MKEQYGTGREDGKLKLDKIIQEIKDVESNERISIRLKDGRFLARVQTTIPLDETPLFGQTK